LSAWAKALFNPARLALVGASSKPGKAGHLLMTNLTSEDSGFKGEVLPIHPKETEIFGLQAYPRIQDAPGAIDLAVIITPPASLPGVMEDCAAAKVTAALVITGGFAETGDEGQTLQDRFSRTAQEAGIRVIGPNCFGVINVHAGLNASLGMDLPSPGGISLITQSGAYGMAAFTRSREAGVGFAKVASPGNKSDVDEVDLLRVLGEDDETRVIAMLIESFSVPCWTPPRRWTGSPAFTATGSGSSPIPAAPASNSPICWRRTALRCRNSRARCSARSTSCSRRKEAPAIRWTSPPIGRAFPKCMAACSASCWQAMKSTPSCRCCCSARP
jgi:predicted CoA-binding protein